MNQERDIFKKGSTTYYFSSWFFPEPVRSDVFKLYSFVRIADNYVDEEPTQPEQLLALERMWQQAWADPHYGTEVKDGDDINTRVIKNVVAVARTYQFDPAWIADFFAAMKADISPKPYKTLDETLAYVHGSAEVIGLMMARILGLPPEAQQAAAMQGRAMQFINFIRDIAEDEALGRCYFPQEELAKFGLHALSREGAAAQPQEFAAFIAFEIARYEQWQTEATRGYRFIPKRYRIPIRTAADMYNWTAKQIKKDPQIIWQHKVKPNKWRVIGHALRRALHG